jgi:membrane protease YdiL (CAAX protease family)
MYTELSQRPLQSLAFLLPLVVLYEVGVYFVLRGDIKARVLLKGVFENAFFRESRWFQALSQNPVSYYLPGLVVVVLLLAIHLVRRDPWRLYWAMYPVMWVESVVLALPVLLFAMVFLTQPEASAALAPVLAAANPQWQSDLIYALGAGIYEELLFRLIGIAILHFILREVLALPRHVCELTAIGVTALLFSLYHFSEANPFNVRRFVFYLLAGVYLACVYIYRGFGIVVGTHAMYDVIVAVMSATREG